MRLKACSLKKASSWPRKGMLEMKKLCEENEEVSGSVFTSNSAVFKTENVVLVMRLLEGRFPDYNLVLPKNNTNIMAVGRKDFLEMLRRVSVMNSDDHKGIKFSLAPKELTLSTVNPDLGEAKETLPVEYEGDEIEVGFNPRYFIEALGSLRSDLINVALLDSGNPCEVKGEEDAGFTGVIMPMKI